VPTTARRYLLRKALSVVLTIFLIVSLNFILFHVLPGDPTRVLLPKGGGSTNVTGGQQLREALLSEWGLDRPIHEQFVIYLQHMFQGDLGTSITYRIGQPVTSIIAPRLLNTIVLVGIATILSIVIGTKLGQIAGWRRGQPSDLAITMVSLVAYSIPTFWLGLILMFVFSLALSIFPSGQLDLSADPITIAQQLALPVTTFVVESFALYTMIMRNSLTDVLTEDYMVTARAKGLSTKRQLRDHAYPNARLPMITVIAFNIGWILSGAIAVEVIFRIQGLGLLTYDAVRARDFPLLSAAFLVATIGVVVANAIADVLYLYLDPRVTEA